jgi:hypothetical protein
MEIITEDYSIQYDAKTNTIYWQGIMRLNTKQYQPIVEFFEKIAALKPSRLVFELQKLRALNSP